MDILLTRALLAGILVALISGPLGSLVLWRRLSFFGDTIAHASLIGVVLGLALGLTPIVGVFIAAFGVAFLMFFVFKSRALPRDAFLAIVSQGALALGILAIYLSKSAKLHLIEFLFGDILSVTNLDLLMMASGSLLVLFILWKTWSSMLSISLSPDLAAVEGINVGKMQGIFLFLLAFSVALSLKIVGVLLITALLIIPAATARIFTKTPETMAITASLLGAFIVVTGLGVSYFFETPTAPSIVAVGLFAFLGSHLKLLQRK